MEVLWGAIIACLLFAVIANRFCAQMGAVGDKLFIGTLGGALYGGIAGAVLGAVVHLFVKLW